VSIGYYPGQKEEGYYNKDMENWFDVFLVGSDIAKAFDNIIDFLNKDAKEVRKRHAQGKQGKNDGSRLIEVDDIDSGIYNGGRGPS
jgi:hypothetical protein